MKLSKDKTQLKYNDFLTLDGIPVEIYDYKLGTRSALEWVVDQYRVKVDRRSGIKNDPNREMEAAVYRRFDWAGYHCEFKDGGDCWEFAQTLIVKQHSRALRDIHFYRRRDSKSRPLSYRMRSPDRDFPIISSDKKKIIFSRFTVDIT